MGGVLTGGRIFNFSREAKNLFSLGVVGCPALCQLWVAFDVPKVSVHFVQRFEFRRCSTLIKNNSRIEDLNHTSMATTGRDRPIQWLEQ